MSTEVQPQGIPAPVAPIVPAVIAAPIAAPAIAPAAPAEPMVTMTPAQMKARLDETRASAEKALATQLGVSVEDAKRIIAEAKAKDDAQKSEVQRLTEQLAAAQAKSTQFDSYKATVEGRAGIEFASLTDDQKVAVESLAGSDPAARLKAIDAMKPTWAAAKANADATALATAKAADDAKAAADAAAKAALPAPKVAAPASTAPNAPPPAPAAPGSPVNHAAVYEGLKKSNPAAAARYHTAHAGAILAAGRQATG
jgi:pilus assembly protein FimV